MTLLERRHLAEEAAIEAAWRWFRRRNRDAQAPFAEVVERARRGCPSVAPESVQAAFEKRWSRWRRARRGGWLCPSGSSAGSVARSLEEPPMPPGPASRTSGRRSSGRMSGASKRVTRAMMSLARRLVLPKCLEPVG